MGTSHRWRCCAYLLFGLTVFVDHGHGQLNCVALGLVLWSVFAFSMRSYESGAAFFTAALNFKVQALFFAPAVAAFLLGKANEVRQRHGLAHSLMFLLKLVVVVVGTFAGLWLPFLRGPDVRQSLAVVARAIFPFQRGLLELPVANVWFVMSPWISLQDYLPTVGYQAAFIAVCVLIAISRSCFRLVMRPSIEQLLISMAATSLCFFILGFQVHEKGIVFPLLPISCLGVFGYHRVISWTTTFAWLSLLPLARLDHLLVPFYCALLAWFAVLISTTRQAGKFALVLGVAVLCSLLILLGWILPPGIRFDSTQNYIALTVSLSQFIAAIWWLNKQQALLYTRTPELGFDTKLKVE